MKTVVFGIMDGTPQREWQLDDIQDWCGACVCVHDLNTLAQTGQTDNR